MLKKILCTVLFIVLAVGTVYSWQKVGFSRKTAMFFQVVFGDENSLGGPGGRPPRGENRGGDVSRPELPTGQEQRRNSRGGQSGTPQMSESGDRGSAPPDFGRRGNAEGRRPGNDGPGRPGGNVSLGNVAKYTVIMAFMVMLTCLLDEWSRKFSRSRKAG